MKAIVALLIISFLSITGIAQTTGKITLTFRSINKSTKNYQASIDGNNYYSNTNSQNSSNYTITLNSVPFGPHTLKVYRLKNNSAAYNGKTANTLISTRSFELRQNFDVNINITASGNVQISESAIANVSNMPATAQMSASNFEALMQNVRGKWSQSLKADALHEAFANTANYFSTAQVRQLLVLVTSESDRLDLAKLAYANVTDQGNFSQLAALFNSTAKRDEFNAFANRGMSSGSVSTKSQMADYQFSQLMQSIRDKWSQSLKGEAIRDALANNGNYFNIGQIRQMLSLVTSESDRLDLVKLSYARATDASNFYQLSDLFNSTAYRNEFNTYVSGKGGQVAVANTTRAQITDYEFNALLQSIKDKWSQSLKADAERDAFNNTNYYFSTMQIRQLLMQINSESDRLELAKLSYRGATDQTNFAQLGDLFSGTTRTEFNNYVYGKTGQVVSATVRTPMASADFDYLVLTVRANLLQLLKVSAETNIFNNPNNYFSVSQAKQLLSLINSETSRLELAKLSYRTLTDRTNFPQLNELFQSQANRDALAEYARAFRE